MRLNTEHGMLSEMFLSTAFAQEDNKRKRSNNTEVSAQKTHSRLTSEVGKKGVTVILCRRLE